MNDEFGVREVFPDRRTTPPSFLARIKKTTQFLRAVLWCISQPIHIAEH
jgi:hypothetical protein